MSLKRKMQRAAAKRSHSLYSHRIEPPREVTIDAIFCDCHGTLYSHDFSRDELLVKYLNTKYAEGENIVLFTTDILQVRDKIKEIGLHPDLLHSLSDKRGFYGEHLQEWIDDDPIPLISAKNLWHPKDAKFRKHMEDYLRNISPQTPSPL